LCKERCFEDVVLGKETSFTFIKVSFFPELMQKDEKKRRIKIRFIMIEVSSASVCSFVNILRF
jgi:hypothetical protein